MRAMKVVKPGVILETDLRSITRHSDRCLTVVNVQLVNWDSRTRVEWLVCGQASIQKPSNPDLGQYTLKAYLPAGVTDFEHDSAYAFQLPLIGIELVSVDYSQTTLRAWVDPEGSEDFRVPRPGYNPMELPGAKTCKLKVHGHQCYKNPHKMVPEGYFAGPPPDEELFEAVRGKRVEILFSPVYPKD